MIMSFVIMYIVTHIAVYLISDPAFILFVLFLLLASMVRLLFLLVTVLTIRLFRRSDGRHRN
jgi:hypothetical protein